MKTDIIIDAQDQALGRVASRIAFALRGKMDPSFVPHQTVFPKVIVKNADKLRVSERKLKATEFARYSGYPGGRKVYTAHSVAQKDMRELVRRTVWGMLPKNRQRSRMIKQLTVLKEDTK